MQQNNSDEIDLQAVYKGFKKIVKKWIVLFFRGIDFILRNWITITILIVVGIALGYFSNSASKRNNEATVLLRVNFNTADYVYTEIEKINQKIEEKDTIFLEKVGLRTDTFEIRSLEISPIVNLKDIVSSYGTNGRYLEGLLKNVDFEDKDLKIPNTFTSEYKNHLLYFNLSSNATIKTIDNVINQINSNALLVRAKERDVQNMNDRISNNIKIISQIDKVIEAYNSNESLPSPSNEIFVVDKNFDINLILQQKIDLLKANDWLRNNLVFTDEIVVMLNEPSISKVDKGFSNNKILFYPILFVGLFLFAAFMRHSYYYLREVAKIEENK